MPSAQRPETHDWHQEEGKHSHQLMVLLESCCWDAYRTEKVHFVREEVVEHGDDHGKGRYENGDYGLSFRDHGHGTSAVYLWQLEVADPGHAGRNPSLEDQNCP